MKLIICEKKSQVESMINAKIGMEMKNGYASMQKDGEEWRAVWAKGHLLQLLAPDEIIEAQGLKQITDEGAIEAMVDEVIAANPEQVEQFRAGKAKVMGFFVGQVMKASKGKANPQQINALLNAKLKE